jgi:hypothetical protein
VYGRHTRPTWTLRHCSHVLVQNRYRGEISPVSERIKNEFYITEPSVGGSFTVTKEVLSSRNGRDKEDRIGESQPFRERTLSVWDKVGPGGNQSRDLALTKQTRYPPS